MGKPHAPRRGSLQFWPHARAKREAARVRQWAAIKEAKPLGFLGYKAGMCHVIAIDNRPKSLSKDEEISLPVTIIECPPMKVAAVNFYRLEIFGWRLVSTVFSSSVDKELGRVLTLPEKSTKTLSNVLGGKASGTPEAKPLSVKDFDDVRLIVYTQPKLTGIGAKKPKVVEIALGGTKDEKLAYVTEKLGKEILIEEVFKEGNLVDIHAITTGKGFQGPVKRHGVMLRHHKSEKARRANVRGSWTGPKMWTAPHSGKMGFHQRIDYNKWLLKIGKNPADVTSSSGLNGFGVVKNSFALIKGSVPGTKKRVVTLTRPIRPSKKNVPQEAPSIKAIVL